jgi:hypothetical protein
MFTPASTLVISNTLIPANGSFSFTFFFLSSCVAIHLVHLRLAPVRAWAVARRNPEPDANLESTLNELMLLSERRPCLSANTLRRHYDAHKQRFQPHILFVGSLQAQRWECIDIFVKLHAARAEALRIGHRAQRFWHQRY